MQTVMFATGIECSYPTIHNGTYRVDELATTRHYERWRDDLHCTLDLGIHYLRYGVPYYKINVGPGRYDWSFCDEVLPEMQRLGIEPILDMCHFGMPDWLGNSFQNPEFPHAFAEFARAFAQRYPWIRFYTPINEIFVCAKFSALFGWWNEQEHTDRAFITATCNLTKACILAMDEILKVQPSAVFIQSESAEHTHTICGHPQIFKRTEWENQLRFLALDLLYAHPIQADVYAWLIENGLTHDDYNWFMNQSVHVRCVLGNDYYPTNERIIGHDGEEVFVGEVFGWYLVTREYFDRYHKPIMHTETNTRDETVAVAWLWRQWQQILRMRVEGLPILGFTWYSLTDQIDWDTELRKPNGTVNTLGLYDLDRKIRPVGIAYRNLIREFGFLPVIPNGDMFGLL